MATAVLVVVLVVAGITALTVAGARRHSSTPVATVPVPPAATSVTAPAVAFLQRYVTAGGRVVRWDQGGDTVSEGQAYALLLAMATGERSRFASVWHWEQSRLQRPDGLFAYRWSAGHVVGADPATDADLETAWALVLASSRFGVPDYAHQGLRVADAVLAHETVTAGGRLELVAGPWARTAPYVVNPSYLAPEAMEALAGATGDPRWGRLAADSRGLVAGLQGTAPALLPPDWAALSPTGAVTPTGPPSGSPVLPPTVVPSYGLDAQRTMVWMAADCATGGRALAAAVWPTQRTLADRGADIAYSLNGQVQRPATNGLGLVASAAVADAAGAGTTGAALLSDAVAAAHGANYYGDAWAALGSVLLRSALLDTCPPPTGSGT